MSSTVICAPTPCAYVARRQAVPPSSQGLSPAVPRRQDTVIADCTPLTPSHRQRQRIFLVRHGQSEANIDPELYTYKVRPPSSRCPHSPQADHSIPLSTAGCPPPLSTRTSTWPRHVMSRECGAAIARYYESIGVDAEQLKLRMW
jgi:hypothetical protein